MVINRKFSHKCYENLQYVGISSDSIKKAKYRLRKKYPEMFSEKKSDAPEDQKNPIDPI